MSSVSATLTDQAKQDAIIGGLLSHTPTWTVHLGTGNVTITAASKVSDFREAFYAEYVPQAWNPLPLAVDLDHVVHVACASVTFAAPSQMPQQLTSVWVTYIDWKGKVQLLEAWRIPGSPVPFGPGGQPLIVNVAFRDSSP